MIDTITISIPVTSMDINNLEQFTPSASNIFTSDRGYRIYTRNPTSFERESKTYVPIYTLYRRFRDSLDISLNIQFSIPKLLYGNNFQEVSDSDFNSVIDTLESKLISHGILISKERLIGAKVVAIHFSKNILLSQGLNCPMVINQLSKAVDTNLKQDIKQVQFKNGGQILHIHTNDSEFAIYDKVRELEQGKISKQRSVDKQAYTQLNLLDENLLNNYLRLEFRMTGQKGIRRKLKRYADIYCNTPLLFKNLFSKDISQMMLSNFWRQEIRDRYLNIIWKDMDSYELLLSIMATNKDFNEREIIDSFFLQSIISKIGIPTLRTTMGWTGKQGYKWTKRKKILKDMKVEDSRSYIINDIDTQLDEFTLFIEIPDRVKKRVNF